MTQDDTHGSTTGQPAERARQHAVGDVLRRTAQRYPDKLAIVDRERRMSFRQFDREVNRVAHALGEGGVVQGDRLALLSHNCWQYAVTVFAAAKAGVVLVPINFMLNPDEVAFILQHSGAKAIIAEDALAGVASAAAELAGLEGGLRVWIRRTSPAEPGWVAFEAWCDQGDDSEPDVLVADDDPLRLMYTSGTESRPKGVLLTSRSLLAQYVSCIVDGGMAADDVELHSLPMYHCAQLDCFFSVDVYLGATSILLPAPAADVLLEVIERERVTKLFAPPTVWIALLGAPAFETRDLSSLRKGYYGASAMPVEVLNELRRRLPAVRFWNFYGQTEMAPLATILRPDEQTAYAGSAGRPALHVETRCVDEDGREVAPGEVGEIVHRSPHAMLGYYRDPEKTAAAFKDGWLHSGDLGVMTEDGYLSVVDRKKDMIKTGGENVASREVEEAIYEMADVAEVAVFGISHPHWIEAVTAVVVPRAGVQLSVDQVSEHVRARLAGYKRPKYILLAEGLPKNPSGKILKRELRERHAELARQPEPAPTA